MKMIEKIKSKATLLTTSLILLPTSVHADGDIGNGTLDDAVGALKDVGILDKIVPVASLLINIAFAIAGIGFAVKAVWLFAQSKQESNPNEAKSKQTAALNSLWGVAIAVCGGLIINLVLRVFGLGGIFAVN